MSPNVTAFVLLVGPAAGIIAWYWATTERPSRRQGPTVDAILRRDLAHAERVAATPGASKRDRDRARRDAKILADLVERYAKTDEPF